MVATCMREITRLIKRLGEDFPGLVFEVSEEFRFRPPRTVYYNPDFCGLPYDKIALLTLHEAAHAALEHKDYDYDVSLLRMEAGAWWRVREVCGGYGVRWDEEFVQDRLDSYRDWLHGRSLCAGCGVSGWQDEQLSYHCPVCCGTW